MGTTDKRSVCCWYARCLLVSRSVSRASLIHTTQIADAIRRLCLDTLLRDTLVARGKSRAPNFAWERTARIFRSHCRRLTNCRLSEEDHLLIEESVINASRV